MQKLTITTYKAEGGQYVRREEENEAEFVTQKEAIRRRLHIIHASAQSSGSNLIVYRELYRELLYNRFPQLKHITSPENNPTSSYFIGRFCCSRFLCTIAQASESIIAGCVFSKSIRFSGGFRMIFALK